MFFFCSRIGGFSFSAVPLRYFGTLRSLRIPASAPPQLVVLLNAANYRTAPLPPVASLTKSTSAFCLTRSSSCAVSVPPKVTYSVPYLTLYSILRWRVPLPAFAIAFSLAAPARRVPGTSFPTRLPVPFRRRFSYVKLHEGVILCRNSYRTFSRISKHYSSTKWSSNFRPNQLGNPATF